MAALHEPLDWRIIASAISSRALIGVAGVGETVADDPAACRQCGLDDLPDMAAAPRRRSGPGQPVDRHMFRRRPQFLPSGVPPGSRVTTTGRPSRRYGNGEIGRLADPYPFERDETALPADRRRLLHGVMFIATCSATCSLGKYAAQVVEVRPDGSIVFVQRIAEAVAAVRLPVATKYSAVLGAAPPLEEAAPGTAIGGGDGSAWWYSTAVRFEVATHEIA